MDSTEAAQCFKNVTFCFIDATHTHDKCLADIIEWFGAMASNGVIAGHDYTPDWPGVVLAVTEFFRGIDVLTVGNSWVVNIPLACRYPNGLLKRTF